MFRLSVCTIIAIKKLGYMVFSVVGETTCFAFDRLPGLPFVFAIKMKPAIALACIAIVALFALVHAESTLYRFFHEALDGNRDGSVSTREVVSFLKRMDHDMLRLTACNG